MLFGVASILVAAPFVLVQRNFRRLLAYSSIDHAGIMTIFAGFLAHMSKLSLGQPAHDRTRRAECPWKLGAMLLVAAAVIALGLVLPAPIYELARRAALMIGGTP